MKISDGPWANFFDSLENRGNKIVELSESPKAVIFMNGHPRIMRYLDKSSSSILKVLILWESQVTRPRDYNPLELTKYDLIFSPSPIWVQGDNVRYFNWPSVINAPKDVVLSENSNNRVALIASNKYSFVEGEMYSLRRLYIEKNNEIIDVFGKSWNSYKTVFMSIARAFVKKIQSRTTAKFRLRNQCLLLDVKNYRGAADSKAVLKNYRYSLVIENQANYVSEKLFDVLDNGCIPFYVGPDLAQFGIPRDIVYPLPPDRYDVKDLRSIIAEEVEKLNVIRKNGIEFLRSEIAKEYNNNQVLRKLGDEISNYIESKIGAIE